MNNLCLIVLATLTLSHASNAVAAKEVFERNKPHVNVGTLGEIDVPTLTLALAVAAGNPLEQAIDDRTGRVTATVESEQFNLEIATAENDGTTAGKPQDAFFVRCDRSTLSMAQTREHILLARQVGVPVVVFLDVDGMTDAREEDFCAGMIGEMLQAAGYTSSNSSVVAGSLESALAGEKEGLMALGNLIDTLDRCLGQ